MAGDWVKLEHATPDKPEIGIMAEELDLDHDAVFGKVMRFWIWADQQAIVGNALIVTDATLDRITFCPGFTKALLKAGWLAKEKGGYSIPNFDRHGGDSAKTRAMTNRRVAKHRNANTVTKALPEKRREEKKREEEPESKSFLPPSPNAGTNRHGPSSGAVKFSEIPNPFNRS